MVEDERLLDRRQAGVHVEPARGDHVLLGEHEEIDGCHTETIGGSAGPDDGQAAHTHARGVCRVHRLRCLERSHRSASDARWFYVVSSAGTFRGFLADSAESDQPDRQHEVEPRGPV